MYTSEELDQDLGEAADALAGLDDELLGLEPGEADDGRKQARQRPEDDAEIDAEAEAEADEEEAEGDEDGFAGQFVAISNPDGGEPLKVAVSDLVQSHQTLGKIGEHVNAVIQRAEERVYEASRERVQAYDQALNQGVQTLRTWLTALPMPQPPNPSMLDPHSQHYNPDAYNLGKYQYEQAMGLINNARGQLSQMTQQQMVAQEQREALEIERERRMLIQADPTWGGDEKTWNGKRDALVSDLDKYFGISETELDTITNHKFFLVAQAALAMVKSREKAPSLKKQAGAPAKATPARKMPQSVIEQKRGNATQRTLKKTGSVDAAAEALMSRFGHIL